VATVIGSAVVPTLIAMRRFRPTMESAAMSAVTHRHDGPVPASGDHPCSRRS
jgi:hypothetical protein